MRKFVYAGLLTALSSPVALTAGAAGAEATAPRKLSVENTDLGTLLDDPAAKAVLNKHIPAMISNSQIEMARPMTLKQMQQFAGDALTDETLAKIQADLDKLPAK